MARMTIHHGGNDRNERFVAHTVSKLLTTRQDV